MQAIVSKWNSVEWKTYPENEDFVFQLGFTFRGKAQLINHFDSHSTLSFSMQSFEAGMDCPGRSWWENDWIRSRTFTLGTERESEWLRKKQKNFFGQVCCAVSIGEQKQLDRFFTSHLRSTVIIVQQTRWENEQNFTQVNLGELANQTHVRHSHLNKPVEFVVYERKRF